MLVSFIDKVETPYGSEVVLKHKDHEECGRVILNVDVVDVELNNNSESKHDIISAFSRCSAGAWLGESCIQRRRRGSRKTLQAMLSKLVITGKLKVSTPQKIYGSGGQRNNIYRLHKYRTVPPKRAPLRLSVGSFHNVALSNGLNWTRHAFTIAPTDIAESRIICGNRVTLFLSAHDIRFQDQILRIHACLNKLWVHFTNQVTFNKTNLTNIIENITIDEQFVLSMICVVEQVTQTMVLQCGPCEVIVGGKCISDDHTTCNTHERNRVEELGLVLRRPADAHSQSAVRVEGYSSMTRGIGNHNYLSQDP